MECIELVEPQKKYADDIWEFRKEILECDADSDDQFAGCISLDVSESAEEWIKICELRKSEETCRSIGTSVPSNMYLGVRKSDDKVVGVIDLRHHINHPILGIWGGHCGYSVRSSERGKGYAKEMLRLNIQNAKEMGIEKLLVTCDVRNEISERTILANGGIFELTVQLYETEIYAYYFDIPFEETLLRHQTKVNSHEFGEEEMRRWWREKDYSNVLNECTVTREKSVEDIAADICNVVLR